MCLLHQQVKIWFQNRRYKTKKRHMVLKQEAEESEARHRKASVKALMKEAHLLQGFPPAPPSNDPSAALLRPFLCPPSALYAGLGLLPYPNPCGLPAPLGWPNPVTSSFQTWPWTHVRPAVHTARISCRRPKASWILFLSLFPPIDWEIHFLFVLFIDLSFPWPKSISFSC